MSSRPYQGFPYSQPHVTDAPSIDAATASRWNNLPRRVIRPDPPRNVVYVDLPEEGGSQVSRPNDTPSPDKKQDLDLVENPVIYVELPESSSSDVTEPASPEPEPEYVRETIFYDPFENRRIAQKEAETPGSDSSPSCSTGPRPMRPAPTRPPPPSTLNLNMGASASSGCGSTYSTPAGLPASLLSKEASVYGRTPDDFPHSPIPVSDFPEPPPAYSEIASVQYPAQTPPTPTLERQPTPATPTEPPRTIVITPQDASRIPNAEMPAPIGLPNPNRKVVFCHHCGRRVHTLVIWENGPITHVIALVLMCVMLIPLVILVYWTKACKYQNHYCPNCNKKIGYEFPFLCMGMTYTSDVQPVR